MTKEEKLARKQQRKAEKVGLGKLLLWNSSSCSVALSTLMLGYVTFYCTDVLQLAPALVGTLFMVSKIFDSFTDIVAGFIVDRTQTRWGKGRPYEIFMLFLWLSTWLLFSCPTSFATAAKCIWIFCMSVIGILVGCIGYLATFFAGGNMVFFIVAALFVSAGAVPLNMMFNMFIADVADYNEWKGLKRMEGTMGSLTGLAGKIGSAFGGFLMGVLMSASGYVGGADVQVDSAIMMIRVLASVVPLVLMLVVAAILRFYTVDKQMPQIKQDLEARAAATTEAAAE